MLACCLVDWGSPLPGVETNVLLVNWSLVPSCGSLVAGYRRIGYLFASQAIADSSTCSTHCASQDERMMQHTSRLACILRIPVLSGYPFTDHAWIINHITLMQITASINSIGITRVVPCLYMNNHRCTHAFFFHDAVSAAQVAGMMKKCIHWVAQVTGMT